MLVRQAAKADEIFSGKMISEEEIQACLRALCFEQRNIVFIGMAMAGKSTIAKAFDAQTVEMDEIIVEQEGLSISRLFKKREKPIFAKRS